MGGLVSETVDSVKQPALPSVGGNIRSYLAHQVPDYRKGEKEFACPQLDLIKWSPGLRLGTCGFLGSQATDLRLPLSLRWQTASHDVTYNYKNPKSWNKFLLIITSVGHR